MKADEENKKEKAETIAEEKPLKLPKPAESTLVNFSINKPAKKKTENGSGSISQTDNSKSDSED